MNKKAIKHYIKPILVAVLAVTVVVLISIFRYQILYLLRQGYCFDGNITVALDGEYVVLTPEDVMIDPESQDSDKMEVVERDGKLCVAMPGEKVGEYSFYLNIPERENPIRIVIVKEKWWQLMRYDLNVLVKADRGKVECALTCDYGPTTCSFKKVQGIRSTDIEIKSKPNY